MVTVEVNRQAEEDAAARNALLDTSTNADSDGRVFFNLVAVAPRSVWTARTADGARWTLTQTGRPARPLGFSTARANRGST